MFVSSTFSDFVKERNELQEKVFPKLRDMCMEKGFRFQAIDLRWGVSEEAGLNQQTMKICLEEIERSQEVSPRPNFIVLLGDRYGWRPLPYEIPANEFEKIYEIVKLEKNEAKLKLIETWYKRDDNALPPVYDLQPHKRELNDNWEEIENNLHSIIVKAVSKMDLNRESKQKYFASATEQEIILGALEVDGAEDHVFCFSRKINGLPEDQKSADFIDLDDNGNIDKGSFDQLALLKDKLNKKIPNNIIKYETEWESNGISGKHLEQLCEDVEQVLRKIIIEEIEKDHESDDLENEIKEHLLFGKERSKHFVGRKNIQNSINEYLNVDSKEPLVIKGSSGSGKTALMAVAAQEAEKRYSDAEVIFRYIGATDSSSNVISLLDSLCRQISHAYSVDELEIPIEYEKLSAKFKLLLSYANSDKPLIIFIDALDQISALGNAHKLSWLPDYLPDNVHLIVSTLPGEDLDFLESNTSEDNILELKGLKKEEGEEILDIWLGDVSRQLLPSQKEEILNKFSLNGSPLYLKLAYQEVIRWKSYTNPDQTVLGDDIPNLIHDLYSRLSSDSDHGNIMVSHTLGYLAASRQGLSEDELIDVLSEDEEVLPDFKRRSPKSPDVDRLPFVVWSRLYFDLEPYLTYRKAGDVSLLAFYHTQLAQVAKEKYLDNKEKYFHLGLADYFESINLNDRKVDELPWQLEKAEEWFRLKEVITDTDIFMAMLKDSKKYELMNYWYQLDDKYEMVSEYKESIKKHSKNISDDNLAKIYNRLGYFMFDVDRYDDAEFYLRQSIELYKENNGLNSLNTIDATFDLARFLRGRGTKKDNEESVKLFQQSLNHYEQVLGEETETVANTMIELAISKTYIRDNKQVDSLMEKSLDIYTNLNSPKYEKLAYIMSIRGSRKLKKMGNDDQIHGEKLLKESIKICEEKLGLHETTAFCYLRYADFFKNKSDFENAIIYYRKAAQIYEKLFGKGNISTFSSLDNLAIALAENGNLYEAENIFEQCVKGYERLLPGLPETAAVLNNLGLVKYRQNNFKDAEPLFLQSINIYENTLGPNNHQTKNVKDNLNLLKKGYTPALIFELIFSWPITIVFVIIFGAVYYFSNNLWTAVISIPFMYLGGFILLIWKLKR